VVLRDGLDDARVDGDAPQSSANTPGLSDSPYSQQQQLQAAAAAAAGAASTVPYTRVVTIPSSRGEESTH